MGKHDDKTAIGGKSLQFPPTPWTRLLDPSLRRIMLEQLSARYWKPLYFCLRRKGFSNDQAKDLTQGFFSEVVLVSRLVQNADRAKGKFRTLLLTALDRYTAGGQRKGNRPALTIREGDVPSAEMPPELPNDPIEAFDYAWASTLLEDVLEELAGQCRRDGKSGHWKIFCARVLEPILADSKKPSLAEICAEYRIASKTKASNMIVTVKRRFQSILRRRLRQTVASGAEVEGAIRELLEIFSKRRARF
jgi:hypothetical protein